MFSWVCPRCGHEVPPSKTECPFCTPPAPEPVAAPPPQQYQPPQPPYAPPPPPQQAPPQQVPPQYAQQAPPQYWQPQGPPPPPPPQQQYPPQYAQQAPPQYWQPQQYPPQQYPPQQYQPVQEQPPQQYPPLPPPPQQEAPPPQQYQPPPQYAPAPPQYQPPPPPPVAEYRQPEPVQSAPTPWPPPEEQEGQPAWVKAAIAFVGVLVLLGIVYYATSSHGSSAAKDAAKQQTTNPLQKYVEVVGIRVVGGKTVKFLAVNHGGTELTDLTANVTLWASTQRSEEDSVGTFTFHLDSLGPDESKELSAPLKTDKGPADMPDDWRNITADVQVAAAQ